jgi:hypothetical protein
MATTSRGDNVSDIESLSRLVETRNNQADFWNAWMVCALIIAALAAIFVCWTTYMALKRTKQAGEVQDSLMRLKDGQLKRDLHDRDLKIEEAHKAASEVGTNLEQEKQKTARFQKEADEARLALSSQVKDQGPRWKLLLAGKSELVAALSPFSGQRTGLYISGPQILTDEETMSTWGRLADAIGGDGAKWILENGGLIFAEQYRRYIGIHVYVSVKASERTAAAARALNDVLLNILPPPSDKILLLQDPGWLDTVKSKGFPEDSSAPWVRAARDPDLITVVIGTHPQQ